MTRAIKRSEIAVAIAAFTVLTALAFARIWPRFQTATVVGSPFDFGVNVWVLWWGPHAFSQGLNPFFTRMLMAPVGTPLTVDSWIVPWILAWPLKNILTPIGIYNVLAALSYVLTGVAAYALFRLYSFSRRGCAFAAVAFTFSAYRGYQFAANQFELLQTQWMLLMLFAYFSHLRRGSRGRLLTVAAATAALAGFTDMRSFAFGIIFMVVCTVALLWRTRGRRSASLALFERGTLFLAASLIAVSPLIWFDAAALQTFQHFFRPNFHARPGLLVAWRQILIPPAQFFIRSIGSPSPKSLAENNAGYVDPVVLLLALVGGFAARKRRGGGFLAVAAIIFLGLEAARWPLNQIPLLNYLKTPARFSVLTELCLCALAADGWRRVSRRITRPFVQSALWSLFCAALFLEINPLWLTPQTVWRRDGSELNLLRADAGHGSVLDLPLQLLSGPEQVNPRGFLRAMQHQRPLFGGSLSIEPEDVSRHYALNPDVATLLDCQAGRGCSGIDDAMWRRLSEREGVGYVISDVAQETPLNAFLPHTSALRRLSNSNGITVYAIAPR